MLLANHIANRKIQKLTGNWISTLINVILTQVSPGLVTSDINTNEGIELIRIIKAANIA